MADQGPLDGIPCPNKNGAMIYCLNETTSRCVSGQCMCKISSFYGPFCENNALVTRPDLFWAITVVTFVLMLPLLILGIYTLVFFFRKYKPVMPAPPKGVPNAQLIALVFIVLGLFFRVGNRILYMAIGPEIQLIYYLDVNTVHVLGQLSWGLLYPFIFGAFGIQLVLWMDLIVPQPRGGRGSNKRMWIAFFIIMAVLFILEFTADFLLIYNVSYVVIKVYRGILALFLLAMLIVAVVFGIRFFCVLNRRETVSSVRAVRSRQNLTRMVLGSAFLFFLALVVTTVSAFVVIRTHTAAYFAPRFFLRLIEAAGAALLILTFLSMMRSKLELQQDSKTSPLETPLMDDNADDAEL